MHLIVSQPELRAYALHMLAEVLTQTFRRFPYPLPCRSVSTVRPSDLAAVARIRADLRTGTAKESRAAAGVSASEIALALGVSRQSVSAWEAGRSVPSAPHALAYGKALAAATGGAA